MARECKRTRDERRFGRPERLAEMMVSTPAERWLKPRSFRLADEEHRLNHALTVAMLIEAIGRVKVVEATTVAAYSYGLADDPPRFNWDGLIIRPPFSEMFVEAAAPPRCGGSLGAGAWPREWPRRFGFYVQHGPAAAFLDHWREMIDRTGFKTAGAESAAVLIPVWEMSAQGLYGLTFPGCSFHVLLDGGGKPTDLGITSVDRWHEDGGTKDLYTALIKLTAFMALNAFMFMHCKNITLSAVEPDKALNRERKKAKLKPFVRYHTINIEPMKKVLRTEGGVETNGLKKALHIVRGHFATYTEERPLFGKIPGTFWMPAHVRGELKEGVVVSDYTVSPPRKDGP